MGGHGEQRVVLITGTSSAKGMGLATSRALAARGHVVYATVRHPRASPDLAPRRVGTAGPTPQQPDEAAAALADLVESDEPPLAAQSSDDAQAYAAAALRDPSRSTELRRLLASIEKAGARKAGR